MQQAVDHLRGTLAQAKLIGEAPAFVQAVRPLPAIAKSEGPVLLCGETGTGKELAARALHYLSARAPYPFVAVNCGSLPETLVEDELFGHERGAFTDAREPRLGVIAQAERGTLFLDEVDSLSRKAQVSLLRALQDRRYRPIGASVEQPADVRVVTACNAPLERLAREGGLRAALYYRAASSKWSAPAFTVVTVSGRVYSLAPPRHRCQSFEGHTSRISLPRSL